jgi:glycosyltransferase involved in cell wall biosynthesis
MERKKLQPFVSVVTPVYNGEVYIEECIQSVLTQTYENFEYIIVNNCSTDRTAEIAGDYAARDFRIRVYDNHEFLSSLQNFNHSLRQISPESKYCKIVHADDWIFPECIEKMVLLAEADPSVGIVSSYRLVNNKVESDGLPYNQTVFNGRDIARMNLTSGPYTFGSPSALLIRSDLIRSRDKFYNEKYTGADTEACLELLNECNFGFIHQVLSFYRIHENSITGKTLEMGKGLPHSLYRFKKFGPDFLTSQELNFWIKKRKREYYKFLGKNIFRLKDKKFWEYHKWAMKELVKERIDWLRVVGGALYMGLYHVVDTKKNINALINLFSNSQTRKPEY